MTSLFLHEQSYRDLSAATSKLVTICGAGAIGANLAETLARMGFANLRVIDRDTIEAHNLSTQPWQTQDVGSPKARILANMLYRAAGARVDVRALELTESNAANLFAGSDLVIDAFDNIPSRRAVSQACTAGGLACVHVALGGEGDYGGAFWDETYFLPEATDLPDTCDYPLTRPLAILVATAGAEVVVRYLLEGTKRNVEVTLRDLRMG